MAGILRYDPNDIVVDTQKLTTSTWSNNTNNLTVAFTSSVQAKFDTPSSSGQFFIEVYNAHTSSAQAEVQYTLSYGHKDGFGAPNFTNDTGSKGFNAAKCIYNQYRQLVFGDEASNFTFGSHTPDSIYVINVNRSRFKHNLKPGTLNLYLSGAANPGAPENSLAGNPKGVLKLTDDSVSRTGSAVLTNLGRQFNIVSGANGIRSGSTSEQIGGSGSFGHFYPDAGILIFNPDTLGYIFTGSLGGSDQTGPGLEPKAVNDIDNNKNIQKLHLAISGGKYFILDSQEKITSQFYFTRVRNGEFNYTTNPSFIDNNGNLNFNSMIDNPQTYITTVGLYNDNNDLVAVAKVSQPIAKDFTKEALIRVKLDY